MKKIKTGLVAFGISGRIFHTPIITSLPCFELTTVVERNRQESKRHYPWVKVVKHLDELLKDEDIQLVVITTPNETHKECAARALNAGKHVVLEKPFTLTTTEANELIDIAKKNHCLISVYHNRRWDGDFKTIQEILAQKLLGEVVTFEAHFDRYRPVLKTNAWREENKLGAGILYDLGSHLIDQALVLFGKPATIAADVKIQRTEAQVDDYFDIKLNYPNQTVILKAGMLVREIGPRFIIHGSKGSFIKYGLDPQETALKAGASPLIENWGQEPELNWGLLHSTIGGLNIKAKVETLPGDYREFYENIYGAIQKEAELIVKPEAARTVIRIIELAKESSSLQKTVKYCD